MKLVKIKNRYQKDFKTIAKLTKSRVKKVRINSKDNKGIAKIKIHKNMNKTNRVVNRLVNQKKV